MCPATVLSTLLVLLQTQPPAMEARDILAACWSSDSVVRFDGATGTFEGTFISGGPLRLPAGLDYGPDGNLYVSSFYWDTVLKYDGRTGAFLDTFIPTSPVLNQPSLLEFRPDGFLYVLASYDGGVLRYDADSGAYHDTFIPSGSGGITTAFAMTFGPDGDIYLGGYYSKTVVRFDGQTGAVKWTVAHFVDTPSGMAFAPDGNLLVGEWRTGFSFPHNIQRYTPEGADLGLLTNLFTGPLDFLVRGEQLFVAGRGSIDVRDATTGQLVDSMSHADLQDFMAITLVPRKQTRLPR